MPFIPTVLVITLTCPLCGDAPFAKVFEKKGRRFWRCSSCGLEKIHPQPTLQELSDYYDLSYRRGLYKTFTAAGDIKRMTAQLRLKEIYPHIALEGRWLDVGCANGEFIVQLREKGLSSAEGIELSGVAVEQAKKRGLTVHCGTLETLPAEDRFDCITAFDVVEHVLDPLTFLQDIAAHLKPNGKVALTLPDKSSLHCKLMGQRWYLYIPEEHLHYFDPTIMRQLLAKLGLKPLHTGPSYKPMNFEYGLTQFKEYNPLIYHLLSALGVVLPGALRKRIIALPIGEFMVIGMKV